MAVMLGQAALKASGGHGGSSLVSLAIVSRSSSRRQLSPLRQSASGGGRAQIFKFPNVRTSDLYLECLVGCSCRLSFFSIADASEEFGHQPESSSAEDCHYRRLAYVPVPRPEQSDGSGHRIHRSSARFENRDLLTSTSTTTLRGKKI
ncbi:hypothetical protein TIFTF001_032296 [Ficus carica]|uniref:Uncharacterized protein n=1 Tax=Ficus carica TaxID=3494 RepID=A0AA88DWZ7_FICCA|nr:hypothetical protein TIFTF001_032296 [Ficus carica]